MAEGGPPWNRKVFSSNLVPPPLWYPQIKKRKIPPKEVGAVGPLLTVDDDSWQLPRNAATAGF